jgi:FSR family fosmidomycin resistance protein-like MFS transporter
MAVFISAGTLGIALAPSVFSAVIVHWGFERVVLIAIPGIAVSALLIMQVRPPASPAAGGGRFDWAPIRTMRRPLTLLFLAVFFRSAVQVTFTQFLALYLNRERGYSLQMSAWILTVYLTAGAVGGLLGGRLADRFGPRLVIALSFLLSAPCMALFFVVPGWAGIASLIVGGLILLFTIPVNVLVAQELVPQSAGTVSALMMGFAWGSAGLIFIPLTGFLSDHTSLHLALSLLLVWPVAGFFLTLKLPKDLIR